jgi:hypothetical protein
VRRKRSILCSTRAAAAGIAWFRQAQPTVKLNAEKARLNAEKARLNAEKARLNAEKARLNAGKARVNEGRS